MKEITEAIEELSKGYEIVHNTVKALRLIVAKVEALEADAVAAGRAYAMPPQRQETEHALAKSREAALSQARGLAVRLWDKHYRKGIEDASEWRPLNDIAGVLSQIENMVSGLVKPDTQPAPETQQKQAESFVAWWSGLKLPDWNAGDISTLKSFCQFAHVAGAQSAGDISELTKQTLPAPPPGGYPSTSVTGGTYPIQPAPEAQQVTKETSESQRMMGQLLHGAEAQQDQVGGTKRCPICGGELDLYAFPMAGSSEQAKPGSTIPPDHAVTRLLSRIQSYLGNGGLFNPEMMEHDKVRDLLIDCREAFAAQQTAASIGRDWLKDSSLERWFPYDAGELSRLQELVKTFNPQMEEPASLRDALRWRNADSEKPTCSGRYAVLKEEIPKSDSLILDVVEYISTVALGWCSTNHVRYWTMLPPLPQEAKP